jgi:hypothetical protein
MDRVELERINRELELKWGGRPRYRVVFANDQIEVRERVDHRGVHEVARLLKYYNCHDCYILEMDVQRYGAPPAIRDWNGYEMIWPFKKPGSNEPIDPNLKVCMFITTSLETNPKKTAKDYYDMEKKEFDAEVAQNFEFLSEED